MQKHWLDLFVEHHPWITCLLVLAFACWLEERYG
jgi:hypothetical protein